MPEITPSAGPAGATFNGGTITTPLVITPGNNNVVPEIINVSLSGQNVNMWAIHSLDGGGADEVYVDASAVLHCVQGFSCDGSITSNGGISDVQGIATTGVNGGFITRVIGSGALPTVQLASTTGAQLSVQRDVNTITPVTFNSGVANNATCLIELSPDNITYSALGTETEPVGVALAGTIRLVKALVPAAWYMRLTVTNATLGLTTYY